MLKFKNKSIYKKIKTNNIRKDQKKLIIKRMINYNKLNLALR